MGFTAEGEIKGLDLALYNNAGNSLDLSSSIMDRALLHTDNSYRLGAVRAVGHCCFTHQASNTAFRGFGGPQVGPRVLNVCPAARGRASLDIESMFSAAGWCGFTCRLQIGPTWSTSVPPSPGVTACMFR